MEDKFETNAEDKNVKKETKKNMGSNYTHKFSKPVEIEGKTYTTMTFYFENLTGEDIEAVEDELLSEEKYVVTPETSSPFQARLAARAARIPSDEIPRLPIKDYMKIKNKTRNFLISMGY